MLWIYHSDFLIGYNKKAFQIIMMQNYQVLMEGKGFKVKMRLRGGIVGTQFSYQFRTVLHATGFCGGKSSRKLTLR